MYQALYRKWRPQTFDDVVGQSHITETLKNQVKTGRLSHSYIFIGTRGTGKTTCARILAKAVNCLSPVNGNPCCKCPACLGIADGSVLDVVELDAASNNGVENVRALREEAVFSPASVKKRVYIIDEVHMLSTSAFNALLKILEEPPAHLMFILATTELQKVPATILSRCQRHSFHRLDAARLAAYLSHIAQQENFSITPEAAELLGRMAEGGVRDALSLLDQCSAHSHIDVDAVYNALGLAGKRQVTAMLEAILRHDAQQAVSDFSAMWMDGRDGAAFLKELSDLMRDILMLRVAPGKGSLLISGAYEKDVLASFAAQMETEELVAAMETVQRYLEQLRNTKNPKTTVELCLISLCSNTAGESVSALCGRIARLEAQLAAGVPAILPSAAHPTTEQDGETSSPEALSTRSEEEDMLPRESPSASLSPASPAVSSSSDQFTAEDTSSASSSVTGQVSWPALRDAVAPQLPINLQMFLKDESKVWAELAGDVLTLYSSDAFYFGRLNKNGVADKVSQAAKALFDCELRVLLSEKKRPESTQRSLEELKAFKEVRFK